MTTKTYLISFEDTDCAALELALNEISERIPCFIDENTSLYCNGVDCLELTITCRDADAPFVQYMLAPFV